MPAPHLNQREMAAYEAASRAGGSLDLLQGIYGQEMAGATDRYNTNQTAVQNTTQGLMDLAAQGYKPAALQTYLDAQGTINPYLENNPKASGTLEDLVNTIAPPGMGTSPLYQPAPTDPATTEAPQIDPGALDAIKAGATEVQPDGTTLATSGTTTLTDWRRDAMGQLRLAYPTMTKDQEDQLYAFIGNAWVDAGGDPGGVPVAHPTGPTTSPYSGEMIPQGGPIDAPHVIGDGGLDTLAAGTGGAAGAAQRAIQQAIQAGLFARAGTGR